GDDVPDEDARRELDDRGHRPAGGAGEDVDLDAPGGEALGHLDDVDVHPARVAGTWLIKRGSMNTDRRNPVDTTRHRTSPPVVQPTERIRCSLGKGVDHHGPVTAPVTGLIVTAPQ